MQMVRGKAFRVVLLAVLLALAALQGYRMLSASEEAYTGAGVRLSIASFGELGHVKEESHTAAGMEAPVRVWKESETRTVSLNDSPGGLDLEKQDISKLRPDLTEWQWIQLDEETKGIWFEFKAPDGGKMQSIWWSKSLAGAEGKAGSRFVLYLTGGYSREEAIRLAQSATYHTVPITADAKGHSH